MKISLNKTLTTALKIIISLGALIFVFTKIDIAGVIELYRKANPLYLLLALTMFSFSKFIAAIRLNKFFTSIEIILSNLQNIKLYMLGMFYNLFLPGGIGGDGYKIYLLNKKRNVKTSKIFWAVLSDRLSGVLALFCLTIILFYFVDTPFFSGFKGIIWLMIPLSIACFYIFISKIANYLKGAFSISTLLSFLVQISQLFSAFFILKALSIESNTSEYLMIFLISSIVAMLPVSIGGMGLRELTFLYGSQIFLLDSNNSIAVSLMFYLITAFVSFWGIYFSIRTERIGIPEKE